MNKLDSSQEHKDGPTYSISMIYHIDNRSKGKNTHIIISIDAQKAFKKYNIIIKTQPVTLKKLKLNGSMKTYKTF